ncbi:BREX-1 system adenine-specific DNA-methyltransferase PglX [Azospirillum melinis]
MNRNKLKTYAPKARRAFIQAVTARASKFGITASKIEPVQVQGDVVLIGGQAFPGKVAEQRRKLEERIALRGFEQVMEEAAYTWFNRFAAIRFMEVHGYLDHGYRVLSHPEGKTTPEIIEHAEHIDLPGLDREKVIDLKLDGTKDEELYRMLLTAQCNALHAAMPFLFERIDDETELLLPDNLLHSDSLTRQMVGEIDEGDWQAIEIIGWLYQFYISEKKDAVIGNVVKSEDIPAATQLFTPNWIVKYMVQNSLGAKWIEVHPASTLRSKMEYYVESASQGNFASEYPIENKIPNIDPEDLTFLDPACGSGHILVEAYNLFREIYLERGYAIREVPKLILEKNLYGLDIDDRAAQLAGFAILMKASEDDRRLFSKNPHINIMAIKESKGGDARNFSDIMTGTNRFELLPQADLLPNTISQPTLAVSISRPDYSNEFRDLLNTFWDGKNIGSLAKVPDGVKAVLPILQRTIKEPRDADLYERQAWSSVTELLHPLTSQASLLSKQYDIVVSNPPYMGSKGMNPRLKRYVQENYETSKADLMTCFMSRSMSLTKANGYWAMINIPSWMFLGSFEDLRSEILTTQCIRSMMHLGRGVFGSDFGTTAFVIANRAPKAGEKGIYRKLFDQHVEVRSNERIENLFFDPNYGKYETVQSNLSKIPGSPIAYWISQTILKAFEDGKPLSDACTIREGINTGDNDQFLRLWSEVSLSKIAFKANNHCEGVHKWFPHKKGGAYRRWYGNLEYVLNWEDNGRAIHEYHDLPLDYRGAPVRGKSYFFKEALSWSRISSGRFSLRYYPPGLSYDSTAPSIFCDSKIMAVVLGFMNSKVAETMLSATSQTLDYRITNLGRLPVLPLTEAETASVNKLVQECVAICKNDWDQSETSWDFSCFPFLRPEIKKGSVEASSETWGLTCTTNVALLKEREQQLNKLFITLYGLNDEISSIITDEEIAIARKDHHRDVRRLVSYAVGCMLGRFSLAEPGLIYANSGNEGFDASRYGDFPADDDGIIPITEFEWFSDDAANRCSEFLKVAWSPETLKENLKFVADSLGAKANETPMDTIRRYLSRDFYKDHLKTYKKRPIYWLFSSGKEKAFECLVYLHRYNEGTLSRMRMEYVTPLQGRVSARIEQLDRDIQAASTTAAQNKLRKEQEKLKKQQAELIKFDEELRHYADKRIKLDLDDGVKVNYGKFGNLLAEVKTVTGGSDE